MAPSSERRWEAVSAGLYRYQDSCVVWAFETGDGFVVVNAGTGEWVASRDALPGPVRAVVLTHFFRDHAAGALVAAAAGIEVWASFWERELLADPLGHFSRRETWIMYDNGWDLFCPLRPIPVARWLGDWEEIRVGDCVLSVVPTPAASVGAISLTVRRATKVGRGANDAGPLSGERTVAFCGELIHSPGKVLRVAPLQYNYNDFGGALNALFSIDQIRRAGSGLILSSTSPDPITDPLSALDLLDSNLQEALRLRGVPEEQLRAAVDDRIEEITPHLFQSSLAEASTYFLVSRSGKALAIDYGYRRSIGSAGSYPFPRNRRPLLHGLEPLAERTGISRIDAILVTHFHDDHVNGIPMLQRLHGSRCYAADTFADILRRPSAYAFPCTWPEPIDVVALATDAAFEWEEYRFTLVPVSGHTRFSTLIAFDCDGERVVATGDQYFFRDWEHPGAGPAMHNHVYRNGAVLRSFADSQRALERLAPTVILPGHARAYRVPPAFLEWTGAYAEDYERIHSSLMPLGRDEPHFEVDSRAAWLEPYRIRLDEPAPIEFTAHVRNPFPHRAVLRLSMVLPDGWTGSSAEIDLPARGEGTAGVTVQPAGDARCRRQPVALDLRSGDRLFGEVAEALVTIGGPEF